MLDSSVRSAFAKFRSRWSACAALALLLAAACDRPAELLPAAAEDPLMTQAAALQGLENFSPKPGAYLNSNLFFNGLGNGVPAYYDLISRGLKNGSLTGEAATRTFDLWKKTFLFLPRETGQTSCTSNSGCITGLGCDTTKQKCKPESLQQWRDRTGVIVYYNLNELGLGRELACSAFPEKTASGTIETGYACFVTNYGAFFQDPDIAIKDAIYGQAKRNTVCITYRPSQSSPYRVQFWVFDGDGNRQTSANLDHMGARPVPQVCTRCHGGSSGGTEAILSRFLPLNPFTVKWADEIIAETQLTPGLSFAAQAERVRGFNALSTRTPLSSMQTTVVNAMYAGKVDTKNQPAKPPVPTGWSTPGHGTYFEKVVTPYCGTCHFAFDSDWLWSWQNFQGHLAAIRPLVCTVTPPSDNPQLGIMPNAEPAMEQFWGKPIPIAFPTMKSWFLTEGNMGDCDETTADKVPLGCNTNRTVANPIGVPDNTRCGEQPGSGRTCDGLCNDDCHVNADCPSNSECISRRCVDCGKYGQLACKSITACKAPFVKKGLMCDLTSDPVNKTTFCQEYVRLHDPICKTTWDHTCDNEAYLGQRCDLNQSCPTGWRDDVPRPGCWDHVIF
jgi:hypothetical protein